MSPELNHLPIGVFFMNAKAQVTYANLKYRQILAIESVNHDPQWINLIHEDDRQKVLKEWQISAVANKPTHFFCKLVKTNSNTIWTDIRLAPVYDDDNNFTGFTGTLSDITDRVMLEKVLERFKKAVENTDSQVLFTDADGVVTYANNSFATTTGYSPEEIIGTKAGNLWGGLMDKEVYQDMWETIKVKKESYQGELLNKKKSGETYYAHVSITPVLDELGNVEFYVGIERDITYLKEMDKVKSEFISLASHQLRTPLSSVKWLCELFWQEGADKLNPNQKIIIEKIQTENERLIKLVNSLLTVSRIDANKIEFNLILSSPTDFITKNVNTIKPRLADKNQTIEVALESGLPELMLDQKLAGEVLTNLLSNAHKYTQTGGKLRVQAKLDKTLAEPSVVISVTDSGIGIPIDDQHRLFEKFFRAKNAQLSQTDGNGLGLYFVKWAMERHGGKVWFESRENVGTTFYLAFPLPAKS